MSRKLAKKLMYAVVVMAVLAMMIPMSIPVSAGSDFSMLIQDAETGLWVTDGADDAFGVPHAFNIGGTVVKVVAGEGTVDNWTLVDKVIGYEDGYNYGASQVLSENATEISFIGNFGETEVWADGVKVATKKWGIDISTEISDPQTKLVTWNESAKAFFASGSVSDYAEATFIVNDGWVRGPAQGVILHWYLVSGNYAVSTAPGYAPSLITQYDNDTLVPKAKFVQFYNSVTDNPWDYQTWGGTKFVNSTNAAGSASVNIAAWFEEDIQIVIIPEYFDDPNHAVTPEVTTFNFETTEYEVVPQVRWAGEKIVLEANFGMPGDVLFYFQNQSVGTLEGIDDDSEGQTVWTEVDENGIASAILYSATSGQADVIAAYYPYGPNAPVQNQHAFRVYFLNFESLTLGDVDGKRVDHNAGLWDNPSPWNATLDNLTQGLNVSQDALERAQVKGWFVPPQGTQMSTRPAACINIDGDENFGMDSEGNPLDLDDVLAPAGRWILPDDWGRIAGMTNWQQRRLHWDIMDNPYDLIRSTNKLGPYVGENAPTVGPFAPGIEKMTPTGWMAANPQMDSYRPYNTVVPNGALELWDAPMPPAKIIFEIQNDAIDDMDAVGFFKEAMKTDIYYAKVGGTTYYTAPFYQILIPAHEFIPPFNNEFGGGYDWNSFDNVHGPYEFWTIFNRSSTYTATPTSDVAGHPTRVEVYSDNHGEAMVWLNGDWNLNLSAYNDSVDIYYNTVVGYTTVRAMADYPYVRVDQPIVSNTVQKTWYWGGQILGTDPAAGETTFQSPMVLTAGGTTGIYQITVTNGVDITDPSAQGTSNKHVVWVWVCDRDGKAAGMVGAQVNWSINVDDHTYFFNGSDYTGINPCADSVYLEFTGLGFLKNTARPGVRAAGTQVTSGTSWLRLPTQHEMNIFTKFYNISEDTGFAASDFAVAAIDVVSTAPTTAHITVDIISEEYGVVPGDIGTVSRMINFNTDSSYPLDDQIILGDANLDGIVDPADIVAVERIILGMDSNRPVQADANYDLVVNMGDVIRIEKKFLGLD